jgi:hypothetical protein
MASIATWLKDILPQTPGLVRSVAIREFMLACREFFEQSAAWRTVVTIDMDANDPDYTLTPYDANTNITKILGVELSGSPLQAYFRRPPGTYLEGSPYAYFVTEPDTIHLWPKPKTAVADGLTVYVALVPTMSTTLLPDVAESLYYEALRDGVLGRLFAHPAKPYSDAARAQYHLQRFRAAIGAFAGRAKAGNGPSWTFPTFGK